MNPSESPMIAEPAPQEALSLLLARLDAAESALRHAERRARFFGFALIGSVLLTGGTGVLLTLLPSATAQTRKPDDALANGNILIALAARVVALEGKTQDISRQTADPVTGKPTLTISGVNLQVVNGEGKTDSANGVGNLIVGYNERGEAFGVKTERAGSHHVVVGRANNYVRWGGNGGRRCQHGFRPVCRRDWAPQRRAG